MTPRQYRRLPYALFAVLLVLDVGRLVMEKLAAVSTFNAGPSFYLGLLRQPWLWGVVVVGPFQLWVWTRILARTKLSVAYAISSLSYPLTAGVSQLVFNDPIGCRVWSGVLLIGLGVALVSRPEAERGPASPETDMLAARAG